MLHRFLLIVLIVPALGLTACQSSSTIDAANHPGAAAMARDQGYALLYSTISDECDVDKVLILKSPAAPVATLIKAIGQFSRDTKATIENLAKEDPIIALHDQGLPEVESKTREAISSATSKQILFHGGKDLEFRLLLTQHEALNYITYLAASLASRDARENRQRYLAQLSKQSDALHEQVLTQLKAPYVGPPK